MILPFFDTQMEVRLQYLARCLDDCWNVRIRSSNPRSLMDARVSYPEEMRFYVAFMHLCNDLVDAQFPFGPRYCDIGTSTGPENGMVSLFVFCFSEDVDLIISYRVFVFSRSHRYAASNTSTKICTWISRAP